MDVVVSDGQVFGFGFWSVVGDQGIKWLTWEILV